ncbi:MAG: DIP1984 family protein [Jiangellaceae bacterium]
MTLAEALARRADLATRHSALQHRAVASAQHQKGEAPAEDPTELLSEADRVATELEMLIRTINRTNLATEVEPGMTVTDALARRDVLRLRHRFRTHLADAGGDRSARYMRSEIRMVASVDVRALRREADEVARELRALDTRIQEVNWAADLVE